MFLAIDIGTFFGWAIGAPGRGLICYGSHKLKVKKGDHKGKRFHDFREMLDVMIEEWHIEAVWYEMPHGLQGAAVPVLNGYAMLIEESCYRHGAPATQCTATELKKHATGSGKADKGDMVRAALEKFPLLRETGELLDDNTADAAHLLDYALSNVRV